MALFVCGNGEITIDIDALDPALESALQDDQADALVRCAILMVISSLVQGGGWPSSTMQSMTSFMANMKDEVCSAQLM